MNEKKYIIVLWHNINVKRNPMFIGNRTNETYKKLNPTPKKNPNKIRAPHTGIVSEK